MKRSTDPLLRTTVLRAAAIAIAAATTLSTPQSPQGAGTCGRVYTTDADFDLGLLFNVNHTSPNNDQLQLNSATAPLPFVNIACSGRGTLVRIDVSTGAVLGEYLTAPNGMGRDPSRTTVDRLGNVWVSNRAEGGFLNGEPKGSVTRVGIVIGGTRGDKDPGTGAFTPNPVGEYLQGPFQYSTCIDRDGDGLIRTSRGLGNIHAWTNPGGVDSAGGVSSAEDECIINYTRINGANARTVAIDANNDVWTGGLGDLDHEKIDGITGQPIPGTQFNLGAGGYGGLIDGAGILWSARGGSGLLRYDPVAATGVSLGNGCGDYGLAIDPATGTIWHTGLSTGSVGVRDPAGTCIASYPYGSGNAQGVAVDSDDNVWVAHSLFSATTVGHLRTDGTFVGNVPLTHATGSGNGPTGVAVDSNGKLWVACINTNNALRIDPNAGPLGTGGFPVGAVDLVVDLGSGASPYNYSDMTGFVSVGTTAPTGSWTIVQDSGVLGQDWGTFSWTSQEPSGTSIVVEVRAADNPVSLPTVAFVAVGNGQSLCGTGLSGQYVEIRATLSRQSIVNSTPILFDLTANCCSGGGATLDCPPDFVEIWAGGIPAGQADPLHTGTATFATSCTQGVSLTHQDISIVPNTIQNPGAPEVVITRRWTLTDGCGTNLSCDQTITLLSPSGQAGLLTLDVGPGTCPNVIDPLSAGSTKLTLVGTWLHDATSAVRPSLKLRRADGFGQTISLGSLPVSFQDLTRPYYGPSGDCTSAGGEGHLDTVVSVPNWMLNRAFGLSQLASGTTVEIELTGRLSDGTTFSARDSLTVH
jgi:streptogramin lyase